MAKKYIIDFYFDIISPYSFIMFESLLSYRSKWPMQVNLKPFNLMHVFKATGNMSSAVPVKSPYINTDTRRMARYYGIPLTFREDFSTILTSKSSLNANRLICAVQLSHPEKAEAVARSLFRRLWIDGSDIFEKSDFLDVLSSCDVHDAQSLITSISLDQVKNTVKKNTEDAVKDGCFGAPWTEITLENGRKEVFFGADRLHFIGHLMGHKFEGPLISSL